MRVGSIAAGSMVLVLLAPGGHARAGGEEAQAEADRLLAEGTRLYAEEIDYDGARDAFQRSYAARPSWRALNGLALVDEDLGRFVDALETSDRLLAEFRSELTPNQVKEVERRISELERRVAFLDLDLAQEGAKVLIDGIEVGVGPLRRTIRLMPGTHAVVATLDKHVTFTRSIQVEAGQLQPVPIVLAPERVQVVVHTQRERLSRRFPAWVPWLVAGGGVALLAAGGGFTLSASEDYAEFDRAVAAGTPDLRPSPDVDTGALERGDTKQRIAGVLYAAGAAAVVTGVVLLILNQPRSLAREGAALRRSPAVVPVPGGLTLVVPF